MSSLSKKTSRKRTSPSSGFDDGKISYRVTPVKKRKLSHTESYRDDSDEATCDELICECDEATYQEPMPPLEYWTDNEYEVDVISKADTIPKAEVIYESLIKKAMNELLRYLDETIVGDQYYSIDIGFYSIWRDEIYAKFIQYSTDIVDEAIFRLANEGHLEAKPSIIRFVGEATALDPLLLSKKLKITWKQLKKYTENLYPLPRCKKMTVDVSKEEMNINKSVDKCLFSIGSTCGLIMRKLQKIKIVYRDYGYDQWISAFFGDADCEDLIDTIREIRDKEPTIKCMEFMAIFQKKHVKQLMKLEDETFSICCKIKQAIIYGWKVRKIIISRP